MSRTQICPFLQLFFKQKVKNIKNLEGRRMFNSIKCSLNPKGTDKTPREQIKTSLEVLLLGKAISDGWLHLADLSLREFVWR